MVDLNKPLIVAASEEYFRNFLELTGHKTTSIQVITTESVNSFNSKISWKTEVFDQVFVLDTYHQDLGLTLDLIQKNIVYSNEIIVFTFNHNYLKGNTTYNAYNINFKAFPLNLSVIKMNPFLSSYLQNVQRTLEEFCMEFNAKFSDFLDKKTFNPTLLSRVGLCYAPLDTNRKSLLEIANLDFEIRQWGHKIIELLKDMGMQFDEEKPMNELDELLLKTTGQHADTTILTAAVSPELDKYITDSWKLNSSHFNKDLPWSHYCLPKKLTVSSDGTEIRYFSSEEKKNKVLIINALGLPAVFWNKVVSQLIEDHQIILYESRCSNLDIGAMNDVVSLEQHVADINEILEHEKTKRIDVLAWCNGGRIGTLLAKSTDLVTHLFLIAPVFKGLSTVKPSDSKFEEELDIVFDQVIKKEKKSLILSSFLVKNSSKTADAQNLKTSELLAFKDDNRKQAIIVPMSKPEFLINYAKRTKGDESFNLSKVIKEVKSEVILVLGAQDDVISNEFTRNVCQDFTHLKIFEIFGTGHYLIEQSARNLLRLIRHILSESRLPITDDRIKELEIKQTELCY